MRDDLLKLYQLSSKAERMIVGLMSGTSLDGLDIALCRFIGAGAGCKTTLIEFETVPFHPSLKERLKKVVSREQVNLRELTELNAYLGSLYAGMTLEKLASWNYLPTQIDAIASHGQTVFHAPGTNISNAHPPATLQIGDADHLAVQTGIITLSDFRQKHLAGGGQGAPLVPYGDFLLFTSSQCDRILLNIGGISNFTWLPAAARFEQVQASDLGPGNTLMDQYVQQKFVGLYFDRDAAIAKTGCPNPDLLAALLSEPFLNLPLPRTTGPELFNLIFLDHAIEKSGTEGLSPADVLATLCRFTALCIAKELEKLIQKSVNAEIFVSGGGMHNPLLMQHLEQLIPGAEFRDTRSLGIEPDAKEAVLFALLANETLAGVAASFEPHSQGMPSLSMGKISLPN